MTAEELINKLQTMIDNMTISPTIEVKVLHPEFDILSDIVISHSIIPSCTTIYLRLI